MICQTISSVPNFRSPSKVFWYITSCLHTCYLRLDSISIARSTEAERINLFVEAHRMGQNLACFTRSQSNWIPYLEVQACHDLWVDWQSTSIFVFALGLNILNIFTRQNVERCQSFHSREKRYRDF
jgi:hypothetical protein